MLIAIWYDDLIKELTEETIGIILMCSELKQGKNIISIFLFFHVYDLIKTLTMNEKATRR